MYELIIANKNYSSWSMRPWVLMRELGIGFRERLLPFHANHDAGDFRKFSPSGRVPCLVDGALRVWDSLAITEYLAERHLGVWPSQADARAWARCAAAEMHSGFAALRNHCSMNIGLRLRMRAVPEGVRSDLARLESLWAEGLDRHGGPFLAGARFSAVDAFFTPVATRVVTYGLPVSERSQAFLSGLLELPAVKAWTEEALREPWRDPPHEQEALATCDVLQDLRR